MGYRTFILATLLTCHHIHIATSYSGGAPAEACGDMVPQHGYSPQTSQSPYIIRLSSTEVKGGDILNVTIGLRQPSNLPFMGFLVKGAKEISDPMTYGNLDLISTNEPPRMETLTCGEAKAMTHSDPSDKTSLTFQWTAPNEPGNYVILGTFVQEKSTFWVGESSERITVTQGSENTTPPPGPGTTTPPPTTSEGALAKMKSISQDCGKNKGCYGSPSGCVEKGNCEMIASWKPEGDNFKFEVGGRMPQSSSAQGHVSIGLSFDDEMGEDSVVGCVYKASENGGVPVAQSFYNLEDGVRNAGFTNKTAGLVIEPKNPTSYMEGWLFCEFVREPVFSQKELKQTFNLKTDKYYILMARASEMTTITVEGTQVDRLGYHQDMAKDTGKSSAAVTLDDVAIQGSASNILIQLHGALMVIAWVVTSSMGMFVARYYKQTLTEFTPINKAFWFVVHLGSMFLTIGITFLGVILIFVDVGGFSVISSPAGQAHPILGLILTAICSLQLIIGLLRPHPGTPKRPIFNWVHWTAGNVGHIVGVACILLATKLPTSGLEGNEKSLQWLITVIVFVIFHVGMHATLSIHTVWADKQMNSAHKLRGISVGPMKPSKPEEAPGSGLRKFLLIAYIGGILAIATTLITLLVMANNP